MTKLRRERYRILGNGYCARPLELDCSFESICETCTYFQPTHRVPTVLASQRDNAATKSKTGRQHLFDDPLNRLVQSHPS